MKEIADMDYMLKRTSIRKGYVNLLEGAAHFFKYHDYGILSSKQAILAKCYDCLTDAKKDQDTCHDEDCPLYPYAFYPFDYEAGGRKGKKLLKEYRKVSPEEAIALKCARCMPGRDCDGRCCQLYLNAPAIKREE